MRRPSRRSPEFAARLGARLRELRSEVNLSQEKLAYEVGVSKGLLSMAEAGQRFLSLPVLELIAERLGVRVADLVAVEVEDARIALLDATRHGDWALAERLLRKARSRRKR